MSSLVHSHKSESFAGEVVWEKTANKKRLKLNADRYFQHFLNIKTKVGDRVTVKITNQKPQRTVQQNRYYWGVYLPLIADKTGEDDLERLHELFKGMFLTKTIAEVLGKKVRITKSTTDLTVSEFCEYVLDIEKFTEVEAPPTENYDLAPLHRPLTPVRKEQMIT